MGTGKELIFSGTPVFSDQVLMGQRFYFFYNEPLPPSELHTPVIICENVVTCVSRLCAKKIKTSRVNFVKKTCTTRVCISFHKKEMYKNEVRNVLNVNEDTHLYK